MRLGRRAVTVALLAGMAAILAPAAAFAVTGVGVGAAPIQATHSVAPASTVALPSLYVVNTGTVASAYGIKVMPIGKAKGLAVPASWVALTPGKVSLKPKAGTWIKVVLSVPAGAARGSYASYLVAGTTTVGTSKGTQATFGGQAATELRFTVDPSGSASSKSGAATGSRAAGRSSGLGPWWAWMTGIAVLVLLIGWKRSGLRLQITRR
jgi:hypothetical protein